MAEIRAFKSIRPNGAYAASIAALPYDVYNRAEARQAAAENPLSFLKIDRAETQLDEEIDMYSDPVYDKARHILDEMIKDAYFIQEDIPCYYIYELTLKGRSQTGLAGCAAIDDYLNNTIKKHENTLSTKEQDRIRHIDRCNAQTGPIFLTYRENTQITEIIEQIKLSDPLYDFQTSDGVTHRLWKVAEDSQKQSLYQLFSSISSYYIADGHHRAASAVKVGLNRRAENPGYSGEEEFNYFLSVLFPDKQLNILPYHRIVHDLNGHTTKSFLTALGDSFEITPLGKEQLLPEHPHQFGLYLKHCWYQLDARASIIDKDIVKQLDVSILQDYILSPILHIPEPKTDPRISFVGGIHRLDILEQKADAFPDAAAFSMYPTSIPELLSTADAGKLMPPKSTWFEPKLRSGLLIHKL